MPITNQLLVSVASARQKYETEKQEKKSVDECRKCKHVLEEIEGMKKRRKQVEMDMEHLENCRIAM